MHDSRDDQRRVPALKFKQWVNDWSGYDLGEAAVPGSHLYLFSMPAAQLRRLCDVYRRTREGSNAEGIQRVRDESRTARIQRYVRYGYPYGDIRVSDRTPETRSLRKPGWLPTAIVVNILHSKDERRGKKVDPDHVITIKEGSSNFVELIMPPESALEEGNLAPLEVIDGQHRLWAFDHIDGGDPIPDDFELPVVAFHGLDVSLQAYLFWSINVSPKRINPSHAFDLYPLLRSQEWLDRVGELTVYREARAQELTEILFVNEYSPWRGRINMLGERGGGVGQAAWVRSLTTTFLSTGRGAGRNGLFQSNIDGIDGPLEWSRAQQAAFLIQLWRDIAISIEELRSIFWIRVYKGDPSRALTDKSSMLNQDMGVRAVLALFNDIFFENAYKWKLDQWYVKPSDEIATSTAEIEFCLASIKTSPFYERIRELARSLVYFDWRSLDGPQVRDTDAEVQKRSYRGSGGYAALRLDVLKTISENDHEVGRAASQMVVNEAAR